MDSEMKKKIEIWALMAGMCMSGVPVSADTPEESYLYVAPLETLNETPINVGSLSALRSLTFSLSAEAQLLNVNTKDGATQSFDLNRIGSLYFSEYASSVRSEQMPVGKFYWQGNLLHTGNLLSGTPIAVYTMDGRLVKQLVATGEPLPVDGLGQGIYLVRAEGVTCKIVK